MDPYRTNRLNHSIHKVLSDLIQMSVKDPRVGFVTLGGVKLNRDHSVAEVFYSVIGDDDERKKSFAGLKKARGFMQSKLVRTLGLRQAPELRFVYDDSVEKGLEMDDLLDGLRDQGEFLSEEEKLRKLYLEDLQPPSELIKGLRAAESLWLVPHHNPDPDAIGSALALAEALRLTGRHVQVVSYPDPPVALESLPGARTVKTSDEAAALYADEEPDTLVLIDCNRIERCGPLEDLLERFENRLCIDHHLVSGRRAPEKGWVDNRASASAVLVHQVIETLAEGDEEHDDEPFEMTLDMATNIYAGLVNDTGGFRFSNTLPLCFELAGELSAQGVDTAAVARQTLYRYRPAGVSLMQQVLSSIEYHADGRIVTLLATKEMLARTGGSLADTEGFVNIATAIEGVRFVAFLKEIEQDVWRASMRVRGQGDVQVVAARYGGGGHKQAAGCTLEGPIEEVIDGLVMDLTGALSE